MSKKITPKSPTAPPNPLPLPIPQLPTKTYKDYFEKTSPSKIEPGPKPVLDFTDEAPAPSQTYYNICVYPFQKVVKKQRVQSEDKKLILNHDKIKAGCVVLRDWPRRRMSQKWSRDGMANPNEHVISFDDFVQGESDSLLIAVFGNIKYNQCLDEVKKQIQLRDK